MSKKQELRIRAASLAQFMDKEYHYLAHDLQAKMVEHSSYHFKFIKNGVAVDIWPGPKKYWCESKRKKGVYHDLEELLKDLLK